MSLMQGTVVQLSLFMYFTKFPNQLWFWFYYSIIHCPQLLLHNLSEYKLFYTASDEVNLLPERLFICVKTVTVCRLNQMYVHLHSETSSRLSCVIHVNILTNDYFKMFDWRHFESFCLDWQFCNELTGLQPFLLSCHYSRPRLQETRDWQSDGLR